MKKQHTKSKNAKPQSDDFLKKATAAYIEAFEKCYHGKTVSIVRGGKTPDGVPRYNVVIDGDKGNRPMTLAEIQEATAELSR